MSHFQSDQLSQSGSTEELDEFASLLKQNFKPSTERAESEIDNAVNTLVKQALADSSLVKEDVLDTIDLMIARLDEKLTAQVNEIIHNEKFQKLESAWRGLTYLVNHTESDSTLKLRVMNITKSELYNASQRYEGAKWDQSPLFRKLYEDEYGTLGGEPYGCLVGDYHFAHTSPDIAVMKMLSKIGAAAHCMVITGADPKLVGQDSWNKLVNTRDISSIFETPDYAGWKSLRDSENARYLGLCMPRILAREPWGAKTRPVAEFQFEEKTDGHDGKMYSWMNAAYGMATNINRAFKESGWTVQIRGVEAGGAVYDLPVHTFPTDDGGLDQKCPTEVSITDRREAELSKAGLLPLIHRKNSDVAAFIGAQSVYKPKKKLDPQATASDNLSARIPYMFAVSRFSHFLKHMVRDWIGKGYETEELERRLTEWIRTYVHPSPSNASEESRAAKPLAEARVDVFPDEENPGYYAARFYIRPHFQLEGMDIGMSLVSQLPGKVGA